MGRWTKAAAAALIVFGAVVVSAPFVLKKIFPPERVRALIVSNAQKSLRRQVRLDDVSYGLIQGLTLENLSISEAPDFSAGTFVQVRRFHIKISWLALLHKKIVVDRVDADGLKLSVLKRGEGMFNFSDLMSQSPAQAPAAAPAAAPAGTAAASPSAASPAKENPFELAVHSASVSDGQIDYADKTTGDALALSGISAKVKGFKLNGAFDADLSARAKGRWGGRDVDGGAAVAGRFDLGGQDPKRFLFDAKKFSLDNGGMAVKGKAKIQGLGPIEGSVDLALSGHGHELLTLAWSGRLERQPVAAYGVEGSGDLKLATRGFKSIEAASLGVPTNLNVPPLRVSGKLALKADAASFEKLSVDTPVGKAVLTGAVAGLSKGPLAPDVAAKLDLDLPALSASQLPFAALPRGMTLPAMTLSGGLRVKGDSVSLDGVRAGMKQGKIEVSGTADALRSGKPKLDLDVRAKVDVPRLIAADLGLAGLPKDFSVPETNVDGRIHVKGDEVALSPLKLRTKSGTIDLSGRVAGLTSGTYEPALDVSLQLSLPALTAADVPFGLAPEGFRLPASRWDGQLFASRDETRVKSLRAVVGRNDVEVVNTRLSGLRGEKPQIDATVKCRSFQLDELADLTPAVKQMDVKGSGFFAVSAKGALSKPILAGKLQFKTLGALVQGLRLSGFTGTASFDEKRIDLPNLTGKLENGDLDLNLTVKNYVTHPAVDLEASLSEFDLGKLLDAKTKVQAASDARAEKKAAAAQAAGKPAPAKPEAAAPMELKGRFSVKRMFHPNFEANDVRVNWDLESLTPDLRRLGGSAKFTVAAGGHFTNLGKAATQSKLVKVLISPFILIQNIGKIGGVHLFPNYDNASYSELMGDYAFSGGIMTIRDSHLYSNVGNAVATGTIDLPNERPDMTVRADVQGSPVPLVVAVGGTFDEPKTKVKVSEMLTPRTKELLQEGGQQLLKNIFKH